MSANTVSSLDFAEIEISGKNCRCGYHSVMSVIRDLLIVSEIAIERLDVCEE